MVVLEGSPNRNGCGTLEELYVPHALAGVMGRSV